MNDAASGSTNRRPVKSRGQKAFHDLAKALAKRGIRPNHVSVASAIFATLAAISIFVAGQSPSIALPMLIAAVLGIQLRLVCNLIDGLIAIECQLRTKTGEIYNDFPDRISDSVLFIAAGYAISQTPFGVELGWAAAWAAALTAYVRYLGNAVTSKQCFAGPMAKQHRMAIFTLSLIAACVESQMTGHFTNSITVALVLIGAGSLVTVARRLFLIARSTSNEPVNK